MNNSSKRGRLPTFLSGMAIGGIIASVYVSLARKNPDKSLIQRMIDRALTETLQNARRKRRLELDSETRYVIFSDHHKGARNPADDFQPCVGTYLSALDFYYSEGYDLIILGDAEELLEEEIDVVMNANKSIFDSESRFYQDDRYIRMYGNHDGAWASEERVKKYLYPYFPDIEVIDGLVFNLSDGERTIGEIFLAHGHQGTIDSDILSPFGSIFLPLYRDFQIKTRLGRTTPAEDPYLRSEHDSQMYRWATKQGKLIFIAGHTHRPVWSSRTHLEKLLRQLCEMLQTPIQERPADFRNSLIQLKKEIAERRQKYPPRTDIIKTIPCYFNTGCCRFEDGDITGIEIDGGQIRLIKWGMEEENYQRMVLEESPLAEIFMVL